MKNNHKEGENIKVGFDGSIKLEFHGAMIRKYFKKKQRRRVSELYVFYQKT